MSLLAIVLVLIVVGVLLWLVETYIRVIEALVIIVVVVWLLKTLGLWAYLAQIHL